MQETPVIINNKYKQSSQSSGSQPGKLHCPVITFSLSQRLRQAPYIAHPGSPQPLTKYGQIPQVRDLARLTWQETQGTAYLREIYNSRLAKHSFLFKLAIWHFHCIDVNYFWDLPQYTALVCCYWLGLNSPDSSEWGSPITLPISYHLAVLRV